MRMKVNDFRYPNGLSVNVLDIDYMDFDLKHFNGEAFFALHIHTTSISASSTPVKKTELYLTAESRMNRVREIHDRIEIATAMQQDAQNRIA